MKTFLAVVAIALCFSGCALNVRSKPPSDVNAESLKEGAVFLGSMLAPNNKEDEVIYLWTGQYASDFIARTQIKGETAVPTTGASGVVLRYFAVTDMEGDISFSSSETARAVIASSKPVHVGNTVIIKNYSPGRVNEWVTSEAVGRGNLVYVGRFVCFPSDSGCEWGLFDEAKTDVPVLKKLNPALPWGTLMIVRDNKLNCENGRKYVSRSSSFSAFMRFRCDVKPPDSKN